VLIRGGGVFERLARARAVAFDKTGTLTAGNPQLVALVGDGVSEAELLRRAAGLEQGSEHALARGIVAAAQLRSVVPETVPNIQARPGQGVVGGYGTRLTAVGNARLVSALRWPIPPALAARADESAEGGRETTVYVGWDGRVRGLFLLADRLRPEARGVVQEMRELGLTAFLLSGDIPATTESVGRALGLDAWQGGLSPEGKLTALGTWSRTTGLVAMVGDGLNDGPVLAGAAVGIAVGSATDLARESADVVLPDDGLVLLPWLARLARRVRNTIMTNLGWAFGYNAVALTLAACGLLQPILAAGLMAGSSLLVVANSLRLERRVGAEDLGRDGRPSQGLGPMTAARSDPPALP
jgi:Cu2+-exporting ATPase